MSWKLFEAIGNFFSKPQVKYGPDDEELVDFILFVLREDPDGWDYHKLTKTEGLLTYVSGNYAVHLKDDKVYLKNDLRSDGFFKVLRNKNHYRKILSAAHGMVNAYALKKIRDISTNLKSRNDTLVDELCEFIAITLPDESQTRSKCVDVVKEVIARLHMDNQALYNENQALLEDRKKLIEENNQLEQTLEEWDGEVEEELRR